MFGISRLDLAVIVGYLAGITIFGLYVSRRVKDTGGFFMGNRGFGKALMIAQALTTGTRADYAIGVAGASYQIGMAGIWYQWMWIFSTPFFWLLSPVFRRMRYVTTADFFEERFSKSLGFAYSLFALYMFMLWQGTIIKGAATTITAITALPENWIIWGVTVLFVLFGVAGGLVATVMTDFIQGIFILILSFVLIPFGLKAVGGFTGLHQTLADAPQMFSLIAPKELTLFTIAMLVISGLVGIVAQPHHMAVAGSGKTEMNCRVGWTYGNFIKRLCTIGWALAGLFAAALVVTGKLPQADLDAKRELAFGAMVKLLLPEGLIGLMIAAIIATVIASCASFMIAGSALFTRNLYQRYIRRDGEDAHYLTVGRIVSAVITIGSLLIALYIPTVISATLHFVEMMAFVGVPMWVAIIWRRANSQGAWVGIVLGIAIFAVTGSLLQWQKGPQLLISLSVSFTATIVVSLMTPAIPEERLRRFYGLLHTPVGEEDNLKKIEDPTGPLPASRLEEEGHSLLIVDLLRLRERLNYRRYRLDLIGFGLAWIWVVLLLLLGYWVTRIGG
ncbi:MAG: sodium:solute symporter family protein [Acidobacteria bacterium]|nr:sodium:solute symporter family protein [Acidobacteriota bacterium]